METNYDVYYRDQPAGKAAVTREGLYYKIVCQCFIREQGMYRILADSETGTHTLGLLCPEGHGLSLSVRVPAKRLGQGKLRFRAISGELREKVIQLDPNKPFAYLSQLEKCRFSNSGGQPHLIFCKEK